MRILGSIAIGMIGLSLSGCSQLSGLFKSNPASQTSDASVVKTRSDASLRVTPEQTYEFEASNADISGFGVEFPFSDDFEYSGGTEYIYASDDEAGSEYEDYVDYAGYEIEFFNTAVRSDPRQAEFVKLNGESNSEDWKSCETINRGYLWVSEYDFTLNPGFEVCMRNKGYILSTEYGQSSKSTLNAQSAGLGDGYPQRSSRPGLSGLFP